MEAHAPVWPKGKVSIKCPREKQIYPEEGRKVPPLPPLRMPLVVLGEKAWEDAAKSEMGMYQLRSQRW